MKARRHIDRASFNPDVVAAMGQAFDTAWDKIKDNFGSDQAIIEGAQLALSHALLSVASEDSRDVGVLTKAALDVMARNYTWPGHTVATENKTRNDRGAEVC
jgi:hypothetical protein